ncbi:MAG: PAS domain-containing protein [Betaproteobacteria bacterium]|nr:PAS domain-containing protein [Betaproteobacteria bacterium]
MRFSLKTKAAAAITIMILVTAAIIATVQTRFIRSGLVDRASAMHAALVAGAARNLDQKLETALLALTREAQVIPAAILERPQELPAYLERQPAMLLIFDALLIFSPTGEVLADAPLIAGRRGLQAGEREYFKRGIATLQPIVSMPYLGRGARRPIVTMIAPILDNEGRLAGFLGGNLDLLKSNLLGALAATPIGRAGYFFAITRQQPSVYIFHPDRSLVLTSSLAEGAGSANAQALAGRDGTIQAADSQGNASLYSYKALGAADWLLGTSYPVAEALAPIIAAEQRLWTISGILALALAPVAWLLTWYLIAPLLRLRDDAQRLRRMPGTISQDLRARKDEIGDLARDFHDLMVARQQSAEAQRRSTQLLDNIVENIPVGIQLKAVDDDLRIVMWNKASETIWGLPRERVIGHTAHDFWSNEEVERYRKADLEAVAARGQEFTNRPGTAADGRAIITHMRKVPLFDAAGVATHLLVIADDVTERVAAEEKLRSSRAFLQSLIDNLPMAITVKDVRPGQYGKMVVWNKGAEVIGGVPEAQALGRSDAEIFAPEVYRGIEAQDRQMLASPMVYEYPEHPFRNAAGRLVYLHSISVPLFGSDEQPEFLLRISEDVTARRRQQKELRAKTAELVTVSDASPFGMFRTDGDGRCTYVNRSYELISGLSAAQTLADGWVQAIHAGDRDRVCEQWTAAVRAGEPIASLFRFQHRDGRVLWASAKAAPIVVDGKVMGYVGSVDDITARREAEHEMQASERRLRTITDTMPAWVAFLDREETYRFTNKAYERAFGLTREQMRGRTIREVLGEAGYEKVKPYLGQVFGGQAVTFEREQLVAAGLRWVEATWIPELDGDDGEVVGFHAMLRDITVQKLEEQRLLRLSQVDSLTGLANRVGFEQHLSDAMAESRSTRQALAVMYLDIDHFKRINDTHGHAAGDALLLAFAQRLKGSLRKTDLVARPGGDEFVAVLERMHDPRVAARLADKALQAIRRPFVLTEIGIVLSVTASIGIAFFDGGEVAAGQLVADADAMLYVAKKRGRDRVCVSTWPERADISAAAVH